MVPITIKILHMIFFAMDGKCPMFFFGFDRADHAKPLNTWHHARCWKDWPLVRVRQWSLHAAIQVPCKQ